MRRKTKKSTARSAAKGKRPAAGKQDATEQLLRRLAHELRTPIGAIVSRAEVMRDERFGPLGDEIYRSYAETIHNSASHALAVVMRTLREFVGDDVGSAGKAVTVDLSEIVEQSTAMVEPVAADAGVALEIELESTPLSVATYRTELTQIVLNVLINAIKFTPPGGVVYVGTSENARGDAVIAIRDNGVGIGPTELSRLRAVDGDGGFGFELSRRLAELCGCSIEIDSNRGAGTNVNITFDGRAGNGAQTTAE